jgi:hypothetical protein
VNGKQKLPIINDTKKENVTSFVCPSWMLVLMNKMLEETGKETYLKPNLKYISMAA